MELKSEIGQLKQSMHLYPNLLMSDIGNIKLSGSYNPLKDSQSTIRVT